MVESVESGVEGGTLCYPVSTGDLSKKEGKMKVVLYIDTLLPTDCEVGV
jgi:hypothetical protein